MKKLINFTAVHGFHWAVLYGAFWLQMPNALNVLIFSSWALAAVCTLFIFKGHHQEEIKKPPPPKWPVRRALTQVQSWTTLLLLVWFGHFWTASAFGWAMLCVAFAAGEITRLRKEAN